METAADAFGPGGLFREQHASVIRVNDFTAMADWYRDVLGLRVVKRIDEYGIAVFDLPGPSYLCLYKAQDPQPEVREKWPRVLINWRTDDVFLTRDELIRRGVACTELLEYPELRLFTFFDPEGTYHDCCEYGADWLADKD